MFKRKILIIIILLISLNGCSIVTLPYVIREKEVFFFTIIYDVGMVSAGILVGFGNRVYIATVFSTVSLFLLYNLDSIIDSFYSDNEEKTKTIKQRQQLRKCKV